MNAAEFNARYPVGTMVFAYPGCRPEDGAGTRLVTRTRTEAQLSASGHPVVWVEGEGSYICLTHIDPVAEDVWEAAQKAETAARAEPSRQTNAAYRASEAILQRQIDEQAKEIDRLRNELTAFRALELGDLDGRVSATCANSDHPTWLRAKEDTRGCPWCRIAELENALAAAGRSLSSFIFDSDDPGADALGAQWLYQQAMPHADDPFAQPRAFRSSVFSEASKAVEGMESRPSDSEYSREYLNGYMHGLEDAAEALEKLADQAAEETEVAS